MPVGMVQQSHLLVLHWHEMHPREQLMITFPMTEARSNTGIIEIAMRISKLKLQCLTTLHAKHALRKWIAYNVLTVTSGQLLIELLLTEDDIPTFSVSEYGLSLAYLIRLCQSAMYTAMETSPAKIPLQPE